MADILYPDLLAIEAEGGSVLIQEASSGDFLEIPGVGDVNVTGATSTPTTIRLLSGVVKKNASKPTPPTATASLDVWRPDLRPCRLVTRLLDTGGKALAKVLTGVEETLLAKAASLMFEITVTTGEIKITGTGSAAFDITDYEPGVALKFGATAADYFTLDRIAGGKGYATPTTARAAAQADIVDPQLGTDPFFVHVTEAPGSSVTVPGSTDGGVNAGSVVLEAVSNKALDWKIIPKA